MDFIQIGDDLSLLRWMQLAPTLPAAPWLWLCRAIRSWVGRGKSSGAVYPMSPGCHKTHLCLLFLIGVKKSVGNCVHTSPQVWSLTFANFWENVLQLPATGNQGVKKTGHSWAGVSLASRNEYVFVFYFLIQNYRWHNCYHQFQLCYFVEIKF